MGERHCWLTKLICWQNEVVHFCMRTDERKPNRTFMQASCLLQTTLNGWFYSRSHGFVNAIYAAQWYFWHSLLAHLMLRDTKRRSAVHATEFIIVASNANKKTGRNTNESAKKSIFNTWNVCCNATHLIESKLGLVIQSASQVLRTYSPWANTHL